MTLCMLVYFSQSPPGCTCGRFFLICYGRAMGLERVGGPTLVI